MRKLFQPLVLLLGRITDRERGKQIEALIRQVHFLKVENRILRERLPKRIVVTAKERQRLLRFGKKLGYAVLTQLLTIVSPTTFYRWRQEATAGKVAAEKSGRRRRLDVRKLILKLAKDNPDWGYTRILGEIRKLTRQKVSRQFVKNVMVEHGFEPGPKRGEKTWDEFLKIHATTLWQCDFFSKKVLTLNGFRDFFMIAFLHVGTRKVFVTRATDHPTAAWVREQARTFLAHAKAERLKVEHVYHDRDSKLGDAFDNVFKAKGIHVERNPICSPNMQAFVERWIQSIQTECLDHFVAFGEKHLNHLVEGYVRYYLRLRPHQSLGNAPLKKLKKPPDDVPALSEVRCKKMLGGLLKPYSRKAA